MTTTIYDSHFYRSQMDSSLLSARKILPVIIDALKPESVIDVGCGVGSWLAASRDLGITDVTGMDGVYVAD